ncbi:MAG TPA: DUF3006 domain-containing protein [Firmicutes bacterium]|nr:DUF3006 domain-containing protein [Bacillota bacterium]
MRFEAAIDRFEGSFAVLLVRGEHGRDAGAGDEEDDGIGDRDLKIDFPRKLLPQDAREGDILAFDLEIDRVATQRQRERIRGLLDKLIQKGDK